MFPAPPGFHECAVPDPMPVAVATLGSTTARARPAA